VVDAIVAIVGRGIDDGVTLDPRTGSARVFVAIGSGSAHGTIGPRTSDTTAGARASTRGTCNTASNCRCTRTTTGLGNTAGCTAIAETEFIVGASCGGNPCQRATLSSAHAERKLEMHTTGVQRGRPWCHVLLYPRDMSG
jgi:hypothetical protein